MLGAFGAAVPSVHAAAGGGRARPNVLPPVSDGCRAMHGCFGGPALTPHLDRLAARGVRDDRCRYTEWNEGRDGVEFHDHRVDPLEPNNLADKEPAVVARLRELLHSRGRVSGDSAGEPPKPQAP